MEYYNNKLCITYAEFTDGIMSVAMLKKCQCEEKVEPVRRGYKCMYEFLQDAQENALVLAVTRENSSTKNS